MDKNYNNSQDDFLWPLLANPANNAHLYAYKLERLVNDFPQSGILQALLAHASDDKNLKKASAYFNPKALYKLINAPATLTGVPSERIITQYDSTNNNYHNAGYAAAYIETAPADTFNTPHENYFSDNSIVETDTPTQQAADLPVVMHEVEDLPAIIHENEQHVDDAVSPQYLEDTAPVIESKLHEAEKAFENPFEYKPTVSTFFHPVEEQEEKTEEAASPVHQEPAIAEHKAHEEIVQYAPPEVHAPDTEQVTPSAAGVDNSVNDAFEAALAYIESLRHENKTAEPELEKVEEPTASNQEEIIPESNIYIHQDEPEVKEPEKLIEEKSADEPVAYINPPVEISQPAVEHHEEKPEVPSAYQAAPVERPERSIREEEERLISGSFASADFFAFNRAQADKPVEQQPLMETPPAPIAAVEAVTPVTPVIEAPATEIPVSGTSKAEAPLVEGDEAEPANTEKQNLSRYNDEKMPYTFMWWLDKTRKEHAGVSQPYVEPESPVDPAENLHEKIAADPLQQQYYENIFHITSVEELVKSTVNAPYNPPPSQLKKKEQVIIERFIQEEPQIKPQTGEKIDNENKAKKSSEDRDELVTETLAAIYTDQMLYHKAIASYKKLILKFPEKSRYFADKIEALEKKTN